MVLIFIIVNNDDGDDNILTSTFVPYFETTDQ